MSNKGNKSNNRNRNQRNNSKKKNGNNHSKNRNIKNDNTHFSATQGSARKGGGRPLGSPASDYSDRVMSIYMDIAQNSLRSAGNKAQKQKLMEFILKLLEMGFTDASIIELFESDPTVGIPVIPRSPGASQLTLRQLAAAPSLVAVAKNLPVCQDTFEWNGNTYSVLWAAYLVNLVDMYRYMQDRIRIVDYDHKCIQDIKQPMRQKLVGGDFQFAYTWNNVNQKLLEFLGESAFPTDIENYSVGFSQVLCSMNILKYRLHLQPF